MNNKKKLILSSSLVIAMCSTMITGATFALFTDTEETNITVNSGKVDVVSEIAEWSTWSMEELQPMNDEQTESAFENGGKAVYDKENATFTLTNVTPGDTLKATITITNNSTVNVKYRAALLINGDLAKYLTVTVDDEQYAAKENLLSDWTFLTAGTQPTVNEMDLVITLPEDTGNDAQEKSANIKIRVEAVQGNAKLSDKWDGTADTSWYDAANPQTSYTLETAEQLAGLAELVDAGNTFEGKTIKLDSDLDLLTLDAEGNKVSFDPIGYGYDVVFKGTFDGQGHTISNLYQNGWALGLDYSTEGGGLFASVVDATIKNVNIDGSEIVMECIDMGTLVGYSYGTCTYENISVSNSTIANYQRYTGGVVGEVNGYQTFKNVDVASDVVVSSLWGDFDCSIGGIVGGKYGNATLTFEDCDVACELNVYNDVTSSYQWYAYRRAGMLIGNTEETVTVNGKTSATASYLTATNCTVTYGEWANYTYCEFAGKNWPYVRVQAGYSSDAYSNPRYGVATDANGNKVVDDTHVHNEGEGHNILLVFDQLFGGGQGVYGTATHDGVTVIYNNK